MPGGASHTAPSSAPAELPATIADRYRIEEQLGRGGMGSVHAAHDVRLARRVAIKLLAPGLQSDEAFRRFEQEARAAAALQHPNIMAVHDAGTSDGRPFIVCELLEGQTLRTRLAEGPLPPARAAEIAAQVAQGLAAAHAGGIVHRDLKPENVFLTRAGPVKILDFGIAKLVGPAEGAAERLPDGATPETLTMTGKLVGTAAYMSPEQIRAEVVGPRADLFSLGAVLYEMLAGRRPFTGATAVEIGYSILRDEPPPLPDGVPAALRRIVSRCLQKDPDDRFQSAKDLAFQLGTFAESPPEPARALPEVRRGRLALRIGLAVAALAAVAGAAIGARRLVGGAAARDPAKASFTRLTFQRGTVTGAKFAPDGSVIYSAKWGSGVSRLYVARPGAADLTPLGSLDASVLAISKTGELALQLGSTSPGTLARASSLGVSPRQLAEMVSYADWGPDGESLAAVRHEPNSRQFLEYPLGNVLLATTKGIGQPKVSPKGDQIVFFNSAGSHADKSILNVIGMDKKIRRLIDVAARPVGVAWDPDGKSVWISASSPSGTEIIKLPLGGKPQVLGRLPGPLKIEDVSADGKLLLHAVQRGHRLKVKSRGDAAERDLTWLDQSTLVDLSADGKTVLLTHALLGMGTPGFYVRPADGSLAVRLGTGFPLRLSDDATRVLAVQIIDGKRELMMLPTGPGQPRRLDVMKQQPWAAQFAIDGKHAYVELSPYDKPDEAVWKVPLDGGPPARVFSGTDEALFSPDERRIAVRTKQGIFAQDPDGANRVLLMDAPKPNVPNGWATARLLRWSPDGSSIFMADYGQPPAFIYRVDTKTGKKTTLHEIRPTTSGEAFISPIQVSADGETYAYTHVEQLSELYVASGWP